MPVPEALIEIGSRHQVYLEGLKTSEANKVEAFLRKLQREVLARFRGDQLENFEKARLARLLSSINRDIDVLTGDFQSQLKLAMQEIGEYEAGFEQRVFQQIVDTEFAVPSAQQLHVAALENPLSFNGQLVDPYLAAISADVRETITGAIRSGYYQGLSTNQIITNLKAKGGAFGQSDRWLRTMVRTSLQHAAEMARQQVWEANDDIVRGVLWVSTLDGRTSPTCRDLDGEIFLLDEGPRPPIHPNCRSRVVANLRSEFADLSEGRVRFARQEGGKVVYEDANVDYYHWLKKRPAGFIDSAIGPTRGKLLRDGGLSVERFKELQLHRNFHPRTLEEIRELEPLAFERAGI